MIERDCLFVQSRRVRADRSRRTRQRDSRWVGGEPSGATEEAIVEERARFNATSIAYQWYLLLTK